MASGQKNSQPQQSPTDADLTINEDEFDIHVVAYRSFQQIFGPGGLAKLEKILESWAVESEEDAHAPLVKRLLRKPSGRIVSACALAPMSSEVKFREVPWRAGIIEAAEEAVSNRLLEVSSCSTSLGDIGAEKLALTMASGMSSLLSS